MKTNFRALLKTKQIEFVGGGYSIHDEATTYYADMIDNMARGHQFLSTTFGIKPTIGWQIDLSGNSRSNVDLFAKMGIDSMFISRIDYNYKSQLMADKDMEFIWKPKLGTGTLNSVFTHVMYDGYTWPKGFCFDAKCFDEPVMNDVRLEDYNLN
jgi:lysosomal alpha-mannosidase